MTTNPTPLPVLPADEGQAPPKRRSLIWIGVVTTVAVAAIAGVLVAMGVRGGPDVVADPAAVKTCNTMADAHNDYSKALYAFDKDDSATNLSNVRFYLKLRPTQMQDALETSPLVMRDDVKDVAQMAELTKRELLGETDGKAGQVAYDFAFADAMQGCLTAGVQEQVFNWDTNQLENVQPVG